MPPSSKKRAKRALDFKQKKLLKSRLIRISMVIDDYVYNHKTISANDAKAYVEEVTTYKTQCKNDARSLQVIEKITRCMNAIITEHQEEANKNNNEYTQYTISENYCPSPTYSLVEEDNAILSETDINNTVYDETNTTYETIDLSQDDDVAIHRNVQIDVEVHRAMSNLSIGDDQNQTMHIDCSQSILSDFIEKREEETKRTAPINKTQNIISESKSCNEDAQANKDCSQNLLREFNLNKPSFVQNTTTYATGQLADYLQDKELSKENSPAKLIPMNKKQNIIKNVSFDDNIKIIDLSEDTGNFKQINRRRINKKQKDNNLREKPTFKGKDKKFKGTNKTIQNAKVPQEPSKSSNADNSVRVASFNDDTNDIHTTLPLHKMNTSVNASVHQRIQSTNICELDYKNNSIYSKSMAKVYNKNVNNDLSWIENIRYVREIATDEYESNTNLANTFWDNLSFPNDWNENDFDY